MFLSNFPKILASAVTLSSVDERGCPRERACAHARARERESESE